MTIGDLIVTYLQQLGVEYVFGVPGTPLSPLFDALARSERQGGPRAVLARHESGAAFMADGYARRSGRIGVCCSTTGPGATNLVTGTASADAERVPLLAITTQTRITDFSFGCFQDSTRNGIDIMGMFEHCTRYNSMVTHPNQLERKLAAAVSAALGSPGGAAHLSIPVDILGGGHQGTVGFTGLKGLLSAKRALSDLAALERLSEEVSGVLRRGGKMVVIAGHGAIGAGDEIVRFAEATGALMVTTPRGKAAIDPYHPGARGVFGCSGHSSARLALAEEGVELILAAGTNLGEWSTSKWDPLMMNNRLIHIHDDPVWFARSPMARLHLHGDVASVFAMLNERVAVSSLAACGGSRRFAGKDGRETAANDYIPSGITVLDPSSCTDGDGERPVRPPRLLAELVSRLPEDSRFFIDNSNSVPWSIHYFFHRRPELYNLSIEFASMGWAIGAAIGSAFADKGSPTLCMTGDGCYLMSGQEITVAVDNGLPVIFVVLKDLAYGLIRHAHRKGGSEPVEFSIPDVDFVMMAEATGARGHRVGNLGGLLALDWRELALRRGPTLLEVIVDPEERPPLAMA